MIDCIIEKSYKWVREGENVSRFYSMVILLFGNNVKGRLTSYTFTPLPTLFLSALENIVFVHIYIKLWEINSRQFWSNFTLSILVVILFVCWYLSLFALSHSNTSCWRNWHSRTWISICWTFVFICVLEVQAAAIYLIIFLYFVVYDSINILTLLEYKKIYFSLFLLKILQKNI